MEKLTLKIDGSNFFNDDLKNYLNSLNGVIDSKIDGKNDEIYVEYDSSIISLKLLIIEISLYLDTTKRTFIFSFDKHRNSKNKKDTIVIKDLCCEYCLMSMIEDILEIDGIESAFTGFDYHKKNNVNIFITYNDKLIKNNQLNEIKKKFNN